MTNQMAPNLKSLDELHHLGISASSFTKCACLHVGAILFAFCLSSFVQPLNAGEPTSNFVGGGTNNKEYSDNAKLRIKAQKLLETLQQALNTKNYSSIEPYLADGVSVGSFAGPTGLEVLQQVVTNYPRQVDSFVITSVHNEATNGTRISATFKCSDGDRDYNFLITDTGLYKEINILKARPAFHPTKILGPTEAQIPFKLDQNLIFIVATVNGTTGLFFVDSGSDNMTINSSYFKATAQTKTGVLGLDFNGVQAESGLFHVKELSLGSIRMLNFDVPDEDLSKLEKALGLKLLGIIGYDQLYLFETRIDFQSQKLTFFRLADDGSKLSQHPERVVPDEIPFELADHLPVITVTIGDKVLHCSLDSGVSVTGIDLRLKDQIEEHYKATRTLNVISDEGLSTNCENGTIDTLVFGNAKVSNSVVTLLDLEPMSEGLRYKIDGVVNYDLLKEFIVDINFKLKRLYLFKRVDSRHSNQD